MTRHPRASRDKGVAMKLALTSVLLLLTFAIAATATPVEPCTPGQTTPAAC